MQFARFRGEDLSDAANALVLQGHQPAEMQFALLQVTLTDALVLNGQQQAAFVRDAEFSEQQWAEQGQRINAGEGHASAGKCIQPGSKELVVGEGCEHDALVLAP
ncbi:MAG: hypothetical protein IPJ27_20185 [Candidatus Accumulibacter sp.]|uniref:Uncharacterized protein n=1 Tax=Candidatus Accumulibacter proximus TaxID=2954385 RepID=A0A935UHM8_9PROT|nr:hypothetical protein [Candidatus Accumulibacter proximus]